MLTRNTETLQKRGDKGVHFGSRNRQKAKLPENAKRNPVMPEMQRTIQDKKQLTKKKPKPTEKYLGFTVHAKLNLNKQ